MDCVTKLWQSKRDQNKKHNMTKMRTKWFKMQPENKNVRADGCTCVSILHFTGRKSKIAALPSNPAFWRQCRQRTECTLLSASVNHQTTATTRAGKPVNNTGMTTWRAHGFWCSLVSVWSQPQLNPIFNLAVFWLSLATAKPPKRQLWSDSWMEVRQDKNTTGTRQLLLHLVTSQMLKCTLTHLHGHVVAFKKWWWKQVSLGREEQRADCCCPGVQTLGLRGSADDLTSYVTKSKTDEKHGNGN